MDRPNLRGSSAALALAIAMAIGMTPVRVGAQDVGDRIRVALPDTTVVGEVLAVYPASLELALADGRVLAANRNEVFRLERSLPRKWVWLGGAWVGFAVGCHLGVCLYEDGLGDADDWKIAGVGAVAGFAVAALSGIELWSRISLPERPEGPIAGDHVRVALADMTIEGNVTGVSNHAFEVAVEGQRIQSMDRSQVLRLETVTARRLWIEGLGLGLVLSGAYFVGKAVGQWGDAAGCAFTLGYATGLCDKLGLSSADRLFVGAIPVVGLIVGGTQRVEAWEIVQPRTSDGGLTPVIDFGVDANGQPVVFLGGLIRH